MTEPTSHYELSPALPLLMRIITKMQDQAILAVLHDIHKELILLRMEIARAAAPKYAQTDYIKENVDE